MRIIAFAGGVLTVLAAVLCPTAALADILIRTDGVPVEGKLISQSATEVVFQTDPARSVPEKFDRQAVARVLTTDAHGAVLSDSLATTQPARWDVPPEPTAPPIAAAGTGSTFYVVPLHGDVGVTVLASALDRSLADAAARKASVVILDIDSPGGLVEEAIVYARDLAAKAGDVNTAVEAADLLCKLYRVKPGEIDAPLSAAFFRAVLTQAAAMDASIALRVDAEAALKDDEYDAALTLAKAAEALGKISQNMVAVSAAQRGLKWAQNAKLQAEKMKGSLSTLTKDPNDPTANLAMGKFCCFMKNDWEHGLPHLAMGSDARLKDAAQKDLAAANGAAAREKLAAAGAWYPLTTVADYNAMPFLQIRIYALYADAAKDLSGLGKVKAEHRMAEFQKVVDAQSDLKVWPLIRKAIAAKQVKQWNFIGGAFSREEMDEVPPEGAILIGFNYTTKLKGAFPGSVQAIYLTPSGEETGRLFGTVEPGAQVMTAKAKPGYALGAVYVRGGGGFDAFQPIFMKITTDGVKTEDRFDGPYVGGQGGGDGTLGDGNFVVGLHMKLGNDGSIGTMSIVTLTTVSPSSVPIRRN